VSRLRAAWRSYRAHRAYLRAREAQRHHCGGMCTTADLARIPAQRRPL